MSAGACAQTSKLFLSDFLVVKEAGERQAAMPTAFCHHSAVSACAGLMVQ